MKRGRIQKLQAHGVLLFHRDGWCLNGWWPSLRWGWECETVASLIFQWGPLLITAEIFRERIK